MVRTIQRCHRDPALERREMEDYAVSKCTRAQLKTILAKVGMRSTLRRRDDMIAEFKRRPMTAPPLKLVARP